MKRKMFVIIFFSILCIGVAVYFWQKEVNENQYLMSSFNNEEMKLLLFESKDGVTFTSRNVEYTPTQGNCTVRDPSITKIGQEYHIVYTTVAWGTGSQIGFCKTDDFLSFQEQSYIQVGNFNKVWAPTFFQDEDGENVYIIFNAAYQDEVFSSYIVKYYPDSHSIDNPVKIEGLARNVIDTEIYSVNDQYYLFYKNEDTKYIEMATSQNICGPYNRVKTDDWAGWGNTLEGPCLIEMNGKYRLYMDNYEEHQIYYSESQDLQVWTEKMPISPSNIAHPCVVKVK